MALIIVDAIVDDEGTQWFESHGLERFGLPELYLRGVPRAFVDGARALVSGAAQALIERAQVPRDGELAIAGVDGAIAFAATWSRGDRGRPDDYPPVIELTSPDGPIAERVARAIAILGGERGDRVVPIVADDATLAAARGRALAELAALAPRCAGGIPYGERLFVKAPFVTDAGGIEWMWVAVQSWTGDLLHGVLTSIPALVSKLRQGSGVVVQQSERFDYIHDRGDGTTAGGEVNRLLTGIAAAPGRN